MGGGSCDLPVCTPSTIAEFSQIIFCIFGSVEKFLFLFLHFNDY